MADSYLPFQSYKRKNMIGSIVELALGWFIVYKAPRLFKAKGLQANIIKLIGWLLMIAGVISFVRAVLPC